MAAALLSVPLGATQSAFRLPAPEMLAPGIGYYKVDAPMYFGADAPISARMLEVRPRDARLDLELGKAGVQGRDTVPAMADRRGALAAVNAGFFGTTGDPAGIFKIDGVLVSDTTRPRGAVGFASPSGAPLLFDRVTARASIKAGRASIPVTGVDTARSAKAVILYTPRYGADTRTTGSGREWTIDGRPARVTRLGDAGASPIPTGGFVISASGDVPLALARLKKGDRVDISSAYTSALGTPSSAWQRADDIVGGAGLLLLRGRAVKDWSAERLDMKGFVDARHPRTLIGRDRDGDIWLVVVDGRQPGHSAGMSLGELTAFAQRIGLVDALNLDGGGSSTMVVKGTVVNRPSDPLGPRPVSDAIVVFSGRPNTPRD
ncbi:MAG: phosphodiester glycosidase family protein [Acidobacteriota bacterium]|nr:phosphodiester glycosidase family protein [Acidobacteriota bacterium]